MNTHLINYFSPEFSTVTFQLQLLLSVIYIKLISKVYPTSANPFIPPQINRQNIYPWNFHSIHKNVYFPKFSELQCQIYIYITTNFYAKGLAKHFFKIHFLESKLMFEYTMWQRVSRVPFPHNIAKTRDSKTLFFSC